MQNDPETGQSSAARSAFTEAQLVAAGGRRWEGHNGDVRFYFNLDLPALLGWEIHRYNTGNVSSASKDGARVGNTKAAAAMSRLSSAKFWFEVADAKFLQRGLTDSEAASVKQAVIEAIAAGTSAPRRGEREA